MKESLQMYGIGDVWLDQSAANEKELIMKIKIRIKDCELQMWSAKIKTVQKLKSFCMFKESFELEHYLLLNLQRKVKRQLTKLRIACHNFQIERDRHTKIAKEDRLSKLCGKNYNMQEIECECCFLLQYSFYDNF